MLNSEVLYAAVWRPSTEGEVQVYGWTYSDLGAKYDQLWGQGWRLHILQAYAGTGPGRRPSETISATARPLEQAEQSQATSGEPSSGARLTFREKSRQPSPSGEFITYVLRADGLPQAKSYSLTGTWMNGKTGAIPETLHLDGSGRVLRKDGDELDLVLGGMFAGEFVVFTLASDDATAKASAEITPFPIEAVGKGGCRLTVRPMSVRGDIFSITGEGFKPGQEIKGVATSSGEVMDVHVDNKDGNLKLVLFPAVAGRKGADASLTASDTSCSVTVRYAWGDAMTRLSPTAGQAAPDAQATAAEHPAPTQAPADAQPAAVTTPGLPKGGEQVRVAMRAVDLDDQIGLVKLLSTHARLTIFLGKEEVTQENAKDVLERLQRERLRLTEEMDRVGFSKIAGNYNLHESAQDQCKLFKGRPFDASESVTVVQNERAVELKGKDLIGCGIVVGNVVIMKAQECAGTSPMRLLGKVTDQGIELRFLNKTDGSHCSLGTLTRRSAE